ncbi:hypothetical protein BDK92_7305 [Micromonospora pisi]|uniref:4Fe-4S Wbl-type domain-containing protein n=1 Tax=Micromonospora pisi TaxID=589240 RepID=A0A495JV04_9ACTN|nr:hypothetical protein [Micromonospora pisi]RKR92823.1 hypothetical protein BDK92_7305 [Micromonospora pisi]
MTAPTIDLDAGWRQHAVCQRNSHVWTTRSLYPLARHICLSDCPVLEQCRAETAALNPWDSCVVAGVAWAAGLTRLNSRAPLKYQPKPRRDGCWLCPMNLPPVPAVSRSRDTRKGARVL